MTGRPNTIPFGSSDYLKDAAAVRASAFVVHGWQDYNVEQREGLDFYEALRGDKQSWMFQGAHGLPREDAFGDALAAFLGRTLLRHGRNAAAPAVTGGAPLRPDPRPAGKRVRR